MGHYPHNLLRVVGNSTTRWLKRMSFVWKCAEWNDGRWCMGGWLIMVDQLDCLRRRGWVRRQGVLQVIPGFCQHNKHALLQNETELTGDSSDRSGLRNVHSRRERQLSDVNYTCEMPKPCKATRNLKNDTAPFFDLVGTLLNNSKFQCHKTRRLKKQWETSMGSVVWRVTIIVSS